MTDRRGVGAWVGACVLLLNANSAFAVAGVTSVNIVEPKVQSKWGYAPARLTIESGTWITWSNAGQDPHTVTAVDGSFDSGDLDPSQGFSWFFADPGTFAYVCTLHPWMTGTVTVGEGGAVTPDTPPPDGDPAASDGSPSTGN